MSTVQIAPDGVPAEFTFSVPAPDGLATLGGVRLYFTFETSRPDVFAPHLYLNGTPCGLANSANGAKSATFTCQLPTALQAPVEARLVVNEGEHLDPGNTVTIYAWGAQTESGVGALNPDEGGEPSLMTGTIDVGQIQVLSWWDWNLITRGESELPPAGS